MYLGALEKQESAKPQVTSQKQIKVKINEMKVKINMKKKTMKQRVDSLKI